MLAVTPVSGSSITDGAIPDDMRELAQKAATAFKANHFDEAAALYQQILKAHPDSVYAWSNLGVTRVQQRCYNDAIKAFETSIAIDPNDALTHYDLSQAYEAVGRHDESEREIKKAKALQSKRPPLESPLPKPKILT